MDTLLWSLILVASLAVLAQSAKVFAAAGADTAKSLGWTSLFMGVTVMALGTSVPELATSLWAAGTQNTSLVGATVVGSNIANVLLILGVCALLTKGLNLGKEGMQRQVGLLLVSAFLLMVTLYDGRFEWFEGILMLGFYILYSFFSIEEHKQGRLEALQNWFTGPEFSSKLLVLTLGCGLITVAASYGVVRSIEELTSITKLLPSVLSASVLALGTSLPELSTAYYATRKGNTDLAVGTVLGSLVFNATLVLALPSFIQTLNVHHDTLVLGLPFLLISTLLLLFALTQKKLSTYEGWAYLLLYILFLFQLYTSF
ncbi:calcium/sodium antiporter [Candidatus Peregrinibacteria bacterium]|nr:MAG: calcium/sodium antiporter [Candidatus Peregrinibacteria bacterium]